MTSNYPQTKNPLRRAVFYILLCGVVILAATSRANALAGQTIKTIIVDNYAPYTYVNEQGQPDGFSVDLIKAVAQVMGFKLEIKVDTWAHAVSTLESGEIDFLPMMAYSTERDKTFDFSPPHTIAYDAFFTRQDASAISSMDDLSGKTIIVMENDQAHQVLKSAPSIKAEQLILVDSLPEALQLLASGKGDTALMPKLVGLLLIRDLNLTNLEPSPVVVEAYNRPFSFAVKNGNQAMLERLNQGMSIIKATGQYDEIYKKWFGALEPVGAYNEILMKYLRVIMLALALIGVILLLWTFLLRRQVAARTQSLKMEIKEHKQAEVALRESETLLRAMAENYPNSYISIVEKDLAIGFTSGQEFKKQNLDPNQFVGLTLEQVFGEHAPLVKENYLKTLGGEETQFELFINDQYQYYRTVPLTDQNGSIYRILAVVENITERKRAEDALRESNDYLENLFNYANAPIIVWDTHFKITRFNHAFEELTGRSEQKILGESLEILFPIDRVELSMELIRKTLTGERWKVVEIAIQHLDGSIRTVLWNSATLFSPDGKTPVATIAQGQDITERKLADNMIKARLRLIEFAATHSLDEVLTKTLDEVCLMVDSPIGFYHFVEPDQKTLSLQAWSTRTMQEYCKAEGKGLHYDVDQAGVWVDCVRQRKAVIHNDYAALPASHRKGLPEGHAELVRELVTPILREDLIVAILGVGNKAHEYTEKDIDMVAYFADVAWEIAERKRMEAEMENVARFPAENPNPILRVNQDGILLYANEAGLLHLPDWHLVIGEPVPQILHQSVTESMSGHLKEWVDTVQGGRVMSFSVTPVKEAGYANFYGRDVTRSRQAEAEREHLLVELERKNKELESIVYVASHDLRSPLVNIQGFSANLQKYFKLISESLKNAQTLDELRAAAEPILAERIPKALKFVEASSMKMDTLISGLLRLSRIGRAQLQMEAVDMNSLVKNILDAMAFQIEKAGAHVRVESPLAACYGDKDQLSQVFSNLLDNAVKYRAPDRPLTITISSEVKERKVTYSIADTGLGIAPEHQEKIWEIFHRFEDDATIPGEGLGLTIARRIIERHNGRVWVESKPEVGSCFYVELPLKM
jgi:PAS domain S-box-containing protein